MTAPLPGVVRASLVELTLDLIADQIQAQFNANLSLVGEMYRNDGRKINLEPLVSNHIYISEGVKPLNCPAVFIIADHSDHDLSYQNMAKQIHSILVAVLVEDMQAESFRITRKALRYGRAMWMTLHDQRLGGPVESQSIYILVEQLAYSPIITTGEGDNRRFRKDATLRLRVQAYENLYT